MIDDADAVLDGVGFDPDRSILTRRQAQVLVLREQEIAQADIADAYGTSRANVSSIESSARENIAKARETVGFAEALTAEVRVTIPAGTDLYDLPGRIFEACDDAGLKVNRSAPELMRIVSEDRPDTVREGTIAVPLVIGVSAEGDVTIRRSD